MLLMLILCIVTLGTAIRTVHQDVLWRWFSFWVYIGGLVLIETRDFQTMDDDDDDNGGAIGADVASSMPMPRHELRLRAAAVLCVMLLLTLIGYVVLQHVLPHVELCLLAWLPVRCCWEIGPLESAPAEGAEGAEGRRSGRRQRRRGRAMNGTGTAGGDARASSNGAMASAARAEQRRRRTWAPRHNASAGALLLVCIPAAPRTALLLGGWRWADPSNASSAAPQRCACRGSISASSGLPHGYGEWSDDATHGERLKGFWEDGVPTAPFASREYGSGHALGAVRVGYLANHGEPFHGPSPFRVRRLPGRQLRYGVSDVEAEVGGHYFRNCPFTTPRMEVRIGDGGADARLPAEKQKEKGLAEEDCGCEGEWWFREAAREAAAEMAKQAAAGDNARSVQRCLRLLASPTVDVRDGRSETQPLTEALLYLPGFNTPLGFSLQRMGQLLALARLPAHIAPFVFSWPGGREMSYLSASRATEEDWMASDLLALFEGLEANGVTKVHVLAHSMGARLLLSSLPRLLSSPAIASPGRLRLANIALLSPDFPLRAFETESVPFLRNLAAAHGTVTTIYGDRHDRPLGYGEVFNRLLRRPSEGWRSLGRLWPVRGLDCDVIDTTWMQAGLPRGRSGPRHQHHHAPLALHDQSARGGRSSGVHQHRQPGRPARRPGARAGRAVNGNRRMRRRLPLPQIAHKRNKSATSTLRLRSCSLCVFDLRRYCAPAVVGARMCSTLHIAVAKVVPYCRAGMGKRVTNCNSARYTYGHATYFTRYSVHKSRVVVSFNLKLGSFPCGGAPS